MDPLSKHTAVLLGGLLAIGSAHAQLAVNAQTDLAALAQAMAGPGVRIANPVIDCHGNGYGEFSYTGNLLDVHAGVILTSGRITDAIGPNNVSNKTFEQNWPGDTLLNTVTGRTTYDACRFEFDVIPGGDSLSFDFVFASEEYNEWVGSQYNDVFGFFINGPGIAGDPGIGNDHNIALVPATGQAVTINNVNAGSNASNFFFNAGGSQVQYDGITRDLRAYADVQPCQTYHLKLIVADASDRKLDSGVLIARIESNAVSMNAFTASGLPNMVEGCNAGTIHFERANALANPLDVSYFLAGTAINGADYPLIGAADPLVAKTATIPANQTGVDVIIDPIADPTIEGTELLRVYLGGSACPNDYVDSLIIGIQDSLYATANAPLTLCVGAEAQLNASGGITYAWNPATGLSDASIADPIASPAISTTYTVTVSAGACDEVLSTSITVSGMVLAANTTMPLCTGGNNGIIDLDISGGIPPYSITWNGPNGSTANSEDLVNLGPGTYTVSVSDGAGCTRVQSFNLAQPQQLAIDIAPVVLASGDHIACAGANTGSIALNVIGGTGPYAIDWSGPNGFASNSEDLSGLPAGTYSVQVIDASGCVVNASATLTEPPVLELLVDDVQAITCFGAGNGSATAIANGGTAPYNYAWNSSPAQATATASNLAAGNFTVIVTDDNGCTVSDQIAITEPAALAVSLTNVSDLVHCQGQAAQDGSATALASGGSAPYAINWNTSPAQSSATATFTTAGIYTVSISDANGCNTTADVTITDPGLASASILAQSNITCFGDDNGSATVEFTGGASITSITWNTSPAQAGPSASALAAGTYAATAQHADGCLTTIDVIIDGPASALVATIDPVNTTLLCAGVDNGSATVQVTGGDAPYVIAWNTSPEQTTATATGLSAGTWMATVTDAFGCTVQSDVTIAGANNPPLDIVITQFTNVLCSDGSLGTATALASGGTAPVSYAWDTPLQETGPTASALTAGTYTVSAIDANGCTDSTSFTILGSNGTIGGIIEDYGNVSCFGMSDGYATIVPYGGSNSFTIEWNTTPPTFGPTATGLGAGTYLVSITDNYGCDTTKWMPVSINGPASQLLMGLVITPVLCAGGDEGAADVTLSGGQAPYYFTWSDDFGNSTGVEDVVDLDAGNYYLHVFDAFGCEMDTSFILSDPAAITTQATVNAIPCQGAATGSIDMIASGGTGALQLSWSGPNGFTANTGSIANLEAGDYYFTATDDNACTYTDMFTVLVSTPPSLSAIVSMYNGAPISCAGSSDGAIDLTVTGGTGSIAIQWTDGLGFSATAQDIDSLQAGGYQVTITDSLGCTADTLIVLAPPAPIAVASVVGTTNGNNIACAGGSDGSIDITVSGGTAPFTFAWDNGSTAEDLNGVPAGAHTVLITDANGCTTTGNWTLTEPNALDAQVTPFIHANGLGISCAGQGDGEIDAIITGGTAPYTTAWTGPNGYASSDPAIGNLFAGTYSLITTDANGCTTITSALLNEPPAIVLSLYATTYNAGTNISCAGGANGAIQSVVNGGVPGYTYQWSGPNSYTSIDPWIQGLAAGNYLLTITDATGCEAVQNIILNEPLPLDVNITLSDNNGFQVGCAGNDGSIDLLISGGTPQYAIGWSGPNGFGTMDEDLDSLIAGDYILQVMDANGCVNNDTIMLNAANTAQFTFNVTGTDCSGTPNGAIDVTIDAGETPMSFSWTGPNGFNSTSEDLNALENGTYTATITDAAGCVSFHSETITGPAPLQAGAYVSFYGLYNLQCMGDSTGAIELDPQGGNGPFSVNVSGPGGYTSTAFDHTALVAGDYQISITDAMGCALDTTISLTAPNSNIGAGLNVSLYPGGTNVSCFGVADAWIDAAVNGGTGPYSYLWRGPDGTEYTTEDLNSLLGSTLPYELVVTDANQCTFTTQVVLTQPAPLNSTFAISQFNGNNISCAGSSDGAIDVTVTGGIPSYTYAWSGPGGFTSSNADISGLIAGSYSFTVTDTNGCVSIGPVLLTAPQPLSAVLDAPLFPGGTNISCFGANDGAINATIAGGTPGIALTWSGPNGFTSTQAQLAGLAPGSYCLSLFDANGCTAQQCVTLTEPQLLAASTTSQPANCGQDIGSVDLNVTGGSAPFSYAWSNGATQEDLAGLGVNTYSVIVTDANACSVISSATVTGTPGVNGSATTTNNLCNGGSEGIIDLSVSSGTAPYSYVWSDGNTNEDRDQLTAGAYSVVVADANGCTWAENWTIGESAALVIDTALSVYNGGYNVSSYGGSDGTISIVLSGGAPPYGIAWSNGSSSTELYNLPAGEYTVTITDANGCVAVRNIILTEPQDLDMPTGYTPNGDGHNDFFVIHGLDAYPNNTFTVLNRWGNVVYDRLNYANDWQGENILGEALPDGTYFVILTINKGERTLQGYVDLRR